MGDKEKGILINAIINILNNCIKKKNKELCKQNLHSDQKILYGADMFFSLAYLNDKELTKISKACGL